jgi:hypothetical protein
MVQFELVCPVCGYIPNKKKKKRMRALRVHFRLQHKLVPDRKGFLHQMGGDSPQITDFKKVRKGSVGDPRFVSGGLPGRGKKR